jgi:hypothetical protein
VELDSNEVGEKVWREFSVAWPEVLNVVEYRFSKEHGEPVPALPRPWTIRMIIFMACEGYCTTDRAFVMIWDLVGEWNTSRSS